MCGLNAGNERVPQNLFCFWEGFGLFLGKLDDDGDGVVRGRRNAASDTAAMGARRDVGRGWRGVGTASLNPNGQCAVSR